MVKPNASARDVAAKIQMLYGNFLEDLLMEGKQLIETLPAKHPRIAQHIFLSTVERVFILIQHTADSFLNELEAGYFTTASLARGLMEAATTLSLLSRDKNGEVFSAYVRQQELLASKRHAGLLKSKKSNNRKLADYAKHESRISGRELPEPLDVEQLFVPLHDLIPRFGR